VPGAAVFVALNTSVTYVCFACLLVESPSGERPAAWKRLLALALALNPVFMFYAGILWKDVMLATMALVASTGLLLASRRAGWARATLIATAMLSISTLPLLRQQGFLLAVPLAFAAAKIAASGNRGRRAVAIGLACLLVMVGASTTFDHVAKRTIEPLPSSPLSVGLVTIRAYDIAGMVANAKSGDPSEWSGAGEDVKAQLRRLYSAQRIDTFWHDPIVRSYVNELSNETSLALWWAGIRHDPWAYLSHRAAAFAYLLGFRDLSGCVPAYWGVAAPAEYLAWASLTEEMDPRDRLIGRWSQALHPTPVFRHWFYLALLSVAALRVARGYAGDTIVPLAMVAAAGLYFVSYAPTTIACDFRYLYPTAVLATALLIWTLLGGSRRPSPSSG